MKYLLLSYFIQLFIKFQRKCTSLKLSVSSLFYASPRSLKEEYSGNSCFDDNNLNLQYTKYVKDQQKV